MLPAVSSEVARYALTGVYLDFANGHIVSSDGKRLHAVSLDGKANVRSLILPPRAFQIITPSEIFVPTDEEAKVAFLEGSEGVRGFRRDLYR